MAIRITPLHHAAPAAVTALLDAAFGADRRQRTAYRIRAGMAPFAPLSFAAFDGTVLAGSLQSWPVALDDIALILVGPVAVAPPLQRRGIGQQLMAALIAAAPPAPLVMIGDPEYYARFFGFSSRPTQGWSVPGPVERHRLLVRHDGALPTTGTLGPRAFALAPANA